MVKKNRQLNFIEKIVMNVGVILPFVKVKSTLAVTSHKLYKCMSVSINL